MLSSQHNGPFPIVFPPLTPTHPTVTEIGDKTFFIAAVLAMRQSR